MGRENGSQQDPEAEKESIELKLRVYEEKSVLNSQGETIEVSTDRTTYLVRNGENFGTHDTFKREVLAPLSQLISQREEMVFRPEGQSIADTLTITTSINPGPHASIHFSEDRHVDRISLSNGYFRFNYHREDDETFSYGVTDVKTTKPIGEPQPIHINDMQFLYIPGVSEALQHQLLRGRVNFEATKDALHENYRLSVPRPLTESLIFA